MLDVVPRGVRLALLQRDVDDVVEHGAVPAVDVDRAPVQELKQLGELAQVVVVREHDGAHERRLAHRVGAEDVCAGGEEQLDDPDPAHRAGPVQRRVAVVVDDDVRVKVGRRVDEEARDLGRLADKVVEDHARVPQRSEAELGVRGRGCDFVVLSLLAALVLVLILGGVDLAPERARCRAALARIARRRAPAPTRVDPLVLPALVVVALLHRALLRLPLELGRLARRRRLVRRDPVRLLLELTRSVELLLRPRGGRGDVLGRERGRVGGRDVVEDGLQEAVDAVLPREGDTAVHWNPGACGEFTCWSALRSCETQGLQGARVCAGRDGGCMR